MDWIELSELTIYLTSHTHNATQHGSNVSHLVGDGGKNTRIDTKFDSYKIKMHCALEYTSYKYWNGRVCVDEYRVDICMVSLSIIQTIG